MKLNQIMEMTIRFRKVDPNISRSLLDLLKNEHLLVQKIDGFNIIKKDLKDGFIGLGLEKNKKIIAGLTYKDKDATSVELYFICASESGNGHASRLIWALKDSCKKTIIDYGSLSDDGLKFIQSLNNTKRFEINWYNLKTHKRESFDQADEKMNLGKKTDWRIIIEGAEEPLDDPYGIITLFETPNP